MPTFEPTILTVVKIAVARNSIDTVLAVMQELAERSRGERGCSRFEVLQQLSDPTRFVTVERWETEAAADAHMRSPHVQAVLTRLSPVLTEPLLFVRYRSVER